MHFKKSAGPTTMHASQLSAWTISSSAHFVIDIIVGIIVRKLRGGMPGEWIVRSRR
jgi:hypothetical protein